MEILFGLTAAVCFGLSDFFARITTRRVGVYRTLLYMQLVGFIGLSVLLVVSGGVNQLHLMERQSWLWEIVAALISAFSYIALYRAFELGQLAVVSPIASAYAAVTVVLSIFTGEHFKLIQLCGIVAILLGVVLTTLKRPEPTTEAVKTRHAGRLPPGVGWAIAAALGLGATFWLLGFAVIPKLGEITPIWFFRLVAIGTMIPLIIQKKESLAPPGGAIGALLVVMGVLDTGAFLSSNLGLALGAVAIVSTITSLYSAVTVVLAWIFLRERLQLQQWGGIILIIAGIFLTQI